MNDIKTIPKVSAKRRTVMKGAAASAGAAAVYAAPAIQKIAVSVAQAASPVPGACFKFSTGGQFSATISGGGLAPAATYTLVISGYDATLAASNTQLSGIIFCCTGNCAIPNGDNLQIGWTQDGVNGNNSWHLDTVVSVSCSISNPNSPQVPLPSPNTLNLVADGSYNLAGGGGTGTARLTGTFIDNGEIGGVNNDATTIQLVGTSGPLLGQTLTFSASTLQTGNYTVVPFNCNPV